MLGILMVEHWYEADIVWIIKVRNAYHSHFLPGIFSKCLRPFHLPGISLSIKVSVTFRSAEFKSLRIVTNECNSMSWIHRT
jgi:hypothetical protein